ncbi:MAG TPA: hypothetical protein PLG75_09055 [Methanoculleus sp.]|nr:hypothetical protein [Methanoculleus sp.]
MAYNLLAIVHAKNAVSACDRVVRPHLQVEQEDTPAAAGRAIRGAGPPQGKA